MRRPALLLAALAFAVLVLALAGLLPRETRGALGVPFLGGVEPPRTASAAGEPEPAAPVLDAPREGERPQRSVQSLPTSAADEAPLDERHARITGVVVERGTRAPVAGARVLALPWARGEGCVADAAGRFALVVERTNDSVLIVAQRAGFTADRALAVDVASGRAEGTLELERNRAVVGRVVDSARVPVAGAKAILQVLVVGEFDEPGTTEFGNASYQIDVEDATTDAHGRFRIDDVAPQGVLELTARAPDGRVARIELGRVVGRVGGAGDVDVGDVVLGPPLTLRGRVVRAWKGESSVDAEPVAGALVRLSPEEEGAFLARSGRALGVEVCEARTSPDGSFAFEGLMPGDYRVAAVVDADGAPMSAEQEAQRAPASSLPATVVSLRGAESEPVCVLVTRTATLRGQVLDAEHRPAPRAQVDVVGSFGAPRATADDQGRFELKELGRTPVTLRVRPTQATTGVLPETTLEGVLPGAGEVRVVLAAAAFVAGRVVDAEGRPVAFAGVTARSATGAELDFAYTDEDGRFRLRAPTGEAIELEACPSRVKEGGVRTLDGQSPLRARARGVRAGSLAVELQFAPRR